MILAISALLALTRCENETTPENPKGPLVLSETRDLMGTTVTIVVAESEGLDEAKIKSAISAAFDRISRVEKAASIYIPSSDISRVNVSAGQKVEVSDEIYRIVKMSLDVAKNTDGAFDITVGPLVEYWKSVQVTGKGPDEEKIKELLTRVGYDKVEISDEGGKKYIRLAQEGMRLDLGGIAKGYAVDRAIDTLREHGVKDGWVEAGGDVRAIGNYGDSEGWAVEARHYAGLPRTFDRWIMHDWSVATSSDYERGFSVGTVRYSHIIDPHTGWALTRLSSASAFAPDCATADALATAVSVLGAEKGREIVEKNFSGCDFVDVTYTAGSRRLMAP
jgi:thiamine biosynthesis lipoprotein